MSYKITKDALKEALEERLSETWRSDGVGREALREELRKQLRLLSPSFIPAQINVELTAELIPSLQALRQVYNARISHYDDEGKFLYQEQDIDLYQYWKRTLYKPANDNYLAVYSRIGLKNGYAIAKLKYPDWTKWGFDDGSVFWIGHELGGGAIYGVAAWGLMKSDGANKIFAYVGGWGKQAYAAEQTVSLPSDYLTAYHTYWVKINENQVWFGIDDRIRVFVLNSKGTELKIADNSKPYTIYTSTFDMPATQHPLVEIMDTKKNGKLAEVSIDMSWDFFRWCEGKPRPPLTMPLYQENTDTVFSGINLDSGSLTSHPIPVFGYKDKTLYFMADQSGTINIELLSQSGNWRTYYSDTYSANDFWWLKMTVDAVLARLVYTPTIYPATISEGEVVMNE